MKRIQLFEFEDFSWFPSSVRTGMTNLIAVLHRMMGISEVLSHLLAGILKENNLNQIVDLGSGSGGCMPDVLGQLHQTDGLQDVRLLMTDLYPNKKIIKKFSAQGNPKISYYTDPVNATDLSQVPAGLKTLVNSFHHMPPKAARQILKTAKDNNEPILIYEMAENKMPLLLWWLLLPISLAILVMMVFFMTPFVKNLTFKQVLFTYLIPVIPICYAWDGQASLPRMYAMKDLDVLLKGLHSDTYSWSKGPALKANGKPLGTYLLGMPKD
ncbi:hypothetical protein [Cytophaga sp. FL35]|uniref:hypothetical protein n=1 Tax=Cytophaga sp. FL35 TaxID=1904456 RepID=UPI001653E7E4|nr:hypothetical protein [Cytophaga sp. FL35]MBC6997644.1 hypothetical protein [Cytophaga sp. FL35]